MAKGARVRACLTRPRTTADRAVPARIFDGYLPRFGSIIVALRSIAPHVVAKIRGLSFWRRAKRLSSPRL